MHTPFSYVKYLVLLLNLSKWKYYGVRRKIGVCKMQSFSQVYKLNFHMWICWIWGNGCSRGAFRMLNCRAFCISLKMKWVFCTKLNRGGCPLPWSPGVAPSAGRCHCQPAAAPRGEYFSNDTLIYKKLMEPPDHDFLLATFKPSVPAWLPCHSVKPTNTKYGSSSWFFSLSAENMHGILKPCFWDTLQLSLNCRQIRK